MSHIYHFRVSCQLHSFDFLLRLIATVLCYRLILADSSFYHLDLFFFTLWLTQHSIKLGSAQLNLMSLHSTLVHGNCISSSTKSTGMKVARGNGNVRWTNKKHFKNVGPIRHCELPHALILHCHSPGVATVARRHVARRLRIDVHDNDDDNDNA